MKKIDFTNPIWGHALHGQTFRSIEGYGSWLTRLIDKYKGICRYSAMVHSEVYPNIGDKIIYKTAHGEREAQIYHIEYCRDPKDMFTLHFFTLHPRVKAKA